MRHYIFEVTPSHTPLASMKAQTIPLPRWDFLEPPLPTPQLPVDKLHYYWVEVNLWAATYVWGRGL